MRTLLIALGTSLAMAGSAVAMDGGCMGSKAYTADAGKHSEPAALQSAEAAKPQTPAVTATSKTADAAVTAKKPS